MLFFYPEIAEDILAAIPPREKDILKRRFGLDREKRETLQEIGNFYGLTRERVRQLQNRALEVAKQRALKKHPAVFNFFSNQLQITGGQRERLTYLERLSPRPHRFFNHAEFLLRLHPKTIFLKEEVFWKERWAFSLRFDPQKFLQKVVRILEREKRPLPLKYLSSKVSVSENVLYGILEASKLVMCTPDKRWGLADWPEINPQRLGDKAYVILKREGRPLHFREIAHLINQDFPKNSKGYNPQSVHNELIKDKRFVLIGRGIYALAEWGYKPGTVEEVIEEILKKARRPLSKEEIMEEVLKQRKVKRSTIYVVLNTSSRFTKTEDGRYTLARKPSLS